MSAPVGGHVARLAPTSQPTRTKGPVAQPGGCPRPWIAPWPPYAAQALSDLPPDPPKRSRMLRKSHLAGGHKSMSPPLRNRPHKPPLRRPPPDILQLAMTDSHAVTTPSPTPVAAGANTAAGVPASGTPNPAAPGTAPTAPTAATAPATSAPADANAAVVPTDESITPDQVRMALRRVKDPELNLNIIDLGLVYDIRVDGSAVTVDMSLTSPGCPSGPEIMGDAERQARAIPGVTAATINLVWTPFWSPDRIEPRVRAYLGM